MLDVIVYTKPHGRQRTISIKNIEESDANFFKNHYIVSMEELTTGDIVVYARPSHLDDEDEVLVMDHGRPCEEVMKELRELCEKTF